MGPVAIGVIIGIIVLVLVIVVLNIKIVPQSKAYVIERLGAYSTTWQTGIHFKIPFVEKVSKTVSLKEQVVDFPPQPVITKDNVTMQIDTVVFFQITDPKLYAYGVERPISAIENLSATTLRNIIGEMELDHTLTSRDVIKNILPPPEIRDAMEKQMKAERQRREAILRAEGEKASKILVAEGQKESQILAAEGDKQAAILHAEAVKEAKIREAEGEAQAIVAVQEAQAKAIALINEAAPKDGYLTIKSLEAFAKAADGKATKLIIPSELQSLAGLAASAKEIFSADAAADAEQK